MTATRRWLLAAHPRGRPLADDDLRMSETVLAAPEPGEMLLRTL